MRVGLLACCFGFLIFCFFEGILDMASIMDGSGVGLLPGPTPLWVVLFFAALPVIWCIRSLWTGGGDFIALAIAVVACLAFFACGFDRGAFVLSWNYRCAHGEWRACYAAARMANDRARIIELYRRACDGGKEFYCQELREAEKR